MAARFMTMGGNVILSHYYRMYRHLSSLEENNHTQRMKLKQAHYSHMHSLLKTEIVLKGSSDAHFAQVDMIL